MFRRSYKRVTHGLCRQNSTVRQLLKIVGTQQDIDYYDSVYKNSSETQCAVIKVGGEVVEKELDVLVKSLSFFRSFGLFPVLVHGAGPQLNDYLKRDSAYKPQYANGMRVTDDYTLQAARKVFVETNLTIVNRLREHNQPASSVIGGLFQAEYLNREIGHVGEITEVNCALLRSLIKGGVIPVILPLAESSSGQILNVNADVVAREVSKVLKPHKTIFVNAKGGWVEDDGTKLAQIDLKSDYKTLMNRDWTGRQGTKLKLMELKHILDSLPPSSSIALTSAGGLCQEVLSHRGVGTRVFNGS